MIQVTVCAVGMVGSSSQQTQFSENHTLSVWATLVCVKVFACQLVQEEAGSSMFKRHLFPKVFTVPHLSTPFT